MCAQTCSPACAPPRHCKPARVRDGARGAGWGVDTLPPRPTRHPPRAPQRDPTLSPRARTQAHPPRSPPCALWDPPVHTSPCSDRPPSPTKQSPAPRSCLQRCAPRARPLTASSHHDHAKYPGSVSLHTTGTVTPVRGCCRELEVVLSCTSHSAPAFHCPAHAHEHTHARAHTREHTHANAHAHAHKHTLIHPRTCSSRTRASTHQRPPPCAILRRPRYAGSRPAGRASWWAAHG
jgi:hypothetical protein